MKNLFDLNKLYAVSNLYSVIPLKEKRQLYGLSRNAFADAIRHGSLNSRQSSDVRLISIVELVKYKGCTPETKNIPDKLKKAFNMALQLFKEDYAHLAE